MKAFVYVGPGLKAIEERPKPEIQSPGDAIVKMLKTTICDTDLHILKGEVRSCMPGCILGHEGVGIIESVGAGVTTFSPGDHVLISCISNCGKCFYCQRNMYSHCTTGGWLLGHKIDGTQAEYVRIPHADTSLYPVPDSENDKAMVMLSDILATGSGCSALNSKGDQGSTVAIVGCGPVGLAALLTARFYAPADIIVIDHDDTRLEIARRFGATATVNSAHVNAVETVKALVGGQGVDTVIEAVGVPATVQISQALAGPDGDITNIGGHARKVILHLERLWSLNMAITTRLFDSFTTTPLLRKTDHTRKIVPTGLVTHHFTLDKILDAYDTFEHSAKTRAQKIIISVYA